MNDRASVVAVVPTGRERIHHLRVAHAHRVAVDHSPHALARNLLHLFHAAPVARLVGKGVAQGSANGVGGVMFHMSGEVQQLLLVIMVGVHSLDLKLSVGQRARLVKHHRAYVGQRVNVVAALHQDAVARGSSNAAKERERHADDQGAGTRHHEEDEGSVQPCGKPVGVAACGKERRQERKGEGHEHHDGRVDPGEPRDERLATRLVLVGALNQADNLRHRALAEASCGAHLQHTCQVYTSRCHRVANRHVARRALARQSHRVKGRRAFRHHAVERHLCAWGHHDGLAHLHLVGCHGVHLLTALHLCRVGTNGHEV